MASRSSGPGATEPWQRFGRASSDRRKRRQALAWPRRIRKPKVAFVLSGGGALGAIQVGMLRALIEAEITPDLIVGCSVGAINGAAVAADPTIEGIDRLEHFWSKVAAGEPDLMPARGRVPTLTQLARKGESLYDPTVLKELLKAELPARTFEQLQVPFSCVATDLELASEHWFDRGRLIPALMASAALPVAYPAVKVDGRLLIDGGVLVELPVERAVELGATEIYVLHVGSFEGRSLEIRRPADALMRTYWTARRHRVEADLRRISSRCVVHRVPSGNQPQVRLSDFSLSSELAQVAYRATVYYLQAGQEVAGTSAPVGRRPPATAEAASDHLSLEENESTWQT